MFIKKLNNKSDAISGANEFIKLECSATPPFNFPKQFTMYITETNKMKTFIQNASFHLLLGALFDSGLTSYKNERALKEYYKELVGLKEVKRIQNISDEDKEILYYAIEKLPISRQTKNEIYRLLKGDTVFWSSFSDATKQEATRIISTLIDECMNKYNAYTQNKRVREIIDEFNKINEYL